MSVVPSISTDSNDPSKITHLQFIQQVIANINGQLITLEKEVSRADNKDNIEITNLCSFIKEMRSKAEQSSSLINDGLSDKDKSIVLNSKLAISGETLKNMDKWVDLINELETELRNCEFDYYRIVADLLQDVRERANQFVLYRALPHVMHILDKVSAIETELKRQVQWTFREIGSLAPSDPEINPNGPVKDTAEELDMNNLNQVYLVIDVLGYSFRRDCLERFAQLQLLQYEKAFRYGTKYCGLDGLDRRYVWFRYLIRVVDEKLGNAFPKNWHVSIHLFSEFTRRTKKHLGDYLSDIYRQIDESDPSKYVGTILASLKSILSFEAEIKASFDVQNRGMDEEERVQLDDVMSTIEPIADAFDPYLGPYVGMERDELDRLMFKLNEEETRPQGNGAAEDDAHNRGPYDSSRQMFEFIKQSLKRCTTFSTGVTYLSLSREYRICLYNYAESLKFRCPSPVAAEAGKPPSYMISIQEEASLCRLVCTGDYCLNTIPSLESKMKEHIQPQYRDEVDFTAQVDAFADMISHTLTIMIAGISTRLEPVFKSMRKIDWSSVNKVGDDSQYVKDLRRVLNDVVPRVRGNIAKLYFQTFSNKLVSLVLDTLNENIWRLKRIAMTGAGQLLLDLNGLKTYFLQMQQMGLQGAGFEEYVPPKAFNILVNQKISKIEVILKLVCVEDDQLQDMFALLWPDGTQEDYDAVQNLKARTGIAAPLDKVTGILTKGAEKVGLDVVGKTVKSTVSNVGGGVKSGIKESGLSVLGGISHAAGDLKGFLTSGSLFDDNGASKPKTTQLKKQASAQIQSTAAKKP